MRSRKFTTLVLLVCLGFALAAANVWFAAKRSTIPLSFDSQALRKQVREEKHPGKDDVYLLHLDDGSVLHVDHAVFDKIPEGARLAKRAWEMQLRVNGEAIELSWSIDVAGMLRAMPLSLVVLAATAWRARKDPELSSETAPLA